MIFKRSRIKTTKWNVFFHYSSFLFAVASGIFLVPLYLRFISVEIYGFWLASGNILSWISIIDPGFSRVTQMRVAESYGARKLDLVGKYALNSLLLTVITLVVLFCVGGIFWLNFPEWLGIDEIGISEQLQDAFLYALFGMLLSFLSFTLVAINQGLQSSFGTGIIFVISNSVSIMFTIWALNRGYGIVALGLAGLLRGFVEFFGNLLYVMARFLLEKVHYELDKVILKELTGLVAFNFIGRIGMIGNSQVSSFLISKYIGVNDLVSYRFTLTIPELSKILFLRPLVAMMPAVNHLIGEGNANKVRYLFFLYYKLLLWCLGCVFVGFYALNESFISLWIGLSNLAGLKINLILVSWVVLSTSNDALSHMLFTLGNVKRNSITSLVHAIVYIVLVLVSIQEFGLFGAACALLLAEIIVPTFYYQFKFIKMLNLSVKDFKSIFEILVCIFLSSVITLYVTHLIGTSCLTWIKFFSTGLFVFFLYNFSLLLLSKEIRSTFFVLRRRIWK